MCYSQIVPYDRPLKGDITVNGICVNDANPLVVSSLAIALLVCTALLIVAMAALGKRAREIAQLKAEASLWATREGRRALYEATASTHQEGFDAWDERYVQAVEAKYGPWAWEQAALHCSLPLVNDPDHPSYRCLNPAALAVIEQSLFTAERTPVPVPAN